MKLQEDERMPGWAARHQRWSDVLAGLLVGLVGGALIALALHKPVMRLLPLGGGFGLLFGLVLGPRSTSPGAGLIWGQGAAFSLWLLLPARATPLWSNGAAPANTMLVATRQQLPELISYLVFLGIPLGIILGAMALRREATHRVPFRWTRPLIAGGLAGAVAGLVFDRWTLSGGFSPLLAGLSGSSSVGRSALVQLAITVILGALFGILFQQNIRSVGSCMGWGLGYALTGWVLGPLTAFPLIRGLPLDWSPASVSNQFGALIGQMLFGVLLGICFAAFDWMWVLLFIQSDPLYKKLEGPALHTFRSLFWGAVSGLLGGLVSAPFMFATGVLSYILGADTHLSVFQALLIHLSASTLIGMSFGVLFRNETLDISLGVAWGSLFGLICWYVGVLTLLPLALNGHLDWRPNTTTMLLPSLIGHLLYGAVSAFIFLMFERRFASLNVTTKIPRPSLAVIQPAATPAPALCFFAIGLGILLPLLLV